MNWSQIRALFPAAEHYTYLNTAAAPPLSTIAAREGKRYYDEMAEHGDVAWESWLCQAEQIREKLATLTEMFLPKCDVVIPATSPCELICMRKGGNPSHNT